jgi:hypothetical protein
MVLSGHISLSADLLSFGAVGNRIATAVGIGLLGFAAAGYLLGAEP